QGLLEPGQVTQVRRDVYEWLLWLADDSLIRQEDHETRAKLSGPDAAPRALCREGLGDAEAARADERRAKGAAAAIEADDYLRGLEALRKKDKRGAVQ